MQFPCRRYPSVIGRQVSGKHHSQIVVLQQKNALTFDIYTNYIEWDIVRCLWIAFYKNNEKNNASCYFYKLPKDIINHIVKFLGEIVLEKNNNANFIAL